MSSRKRRQCLTFTDQLAVIKKIREGVGKHEILREYNIGNSTFYALADRETQVLQNLENCEMKNRKSVKKSTVPELDAAMITWFMQVRDRGDPISGPILQEKARILNLKLHGDPKFQATTGWLRNFKKRYSIRSVEMKGEKLSNNTDSAEEFSQFLKHKIDSENLLLENIYNADESGIYWRSLMTCTLARNSEQEVSGRKESKDRVTALVCSKSSGNHRLPLLIIGKSMHPRCLHSLMTPELKQQRLKFIRLLNVIYTHQTSSWMDRNIFKQWFTNEFIPRVLSHQKAANITGKVVLILDNAPSHPPLEELNAVHENFEVIYLPPNVTAIIQPMEQGAIAVTKKIYKKNLLRRLLIENEFQSASEFLKTFNLQDCMILLNEAWQSIKSSTLKAVWKPILNDRIIIQQEANNQGTSETLSEEINFPHEIFGKLSSIFKGPTFEINDNSNEVLLNWFENDQDDCGWEPWSDDKIVNFVTNGKVNAEKVDEFEEDKEERDHESYEIKRSKAVVGLQNVKNWMQSSENVPDHHYQWLKEIECSLSKNIQAPQNKVYLRL